MRETHILYADAGARVQYVHKPLLGNSVRAREDDKWFRISEFRHGAIALEAIYQCGETMMPDVFVHDLSIHEDRPAVP